MPLVLIIKSLAYQYSINPKTVHFLWILINIGILENGLADHFGTSNRFYSSHCEFKYPANDCFPIHLKKFKKAWTFHGHSFLLSSPPGIDISHFLSPPISDLNVDFSRTYDYTFIRLRSGYNHLHSLFFVSPSILHLSVIFIFFNLFVTFTI